MKISEMMTKLSKIYEEQGDLPIELVYTNFDEDGEEYSVHEEPFVYDSFDAVWLMC